MTSGPHKKKYTYQTPIVGGVIEKGGNTIAMAEIPNVIEIEIDFHLWIGSRYWPRHSARTIYENMQKKRIKNDRLHNTSIQ